MIKVKTDLCMGIFQREDGSIDAFDEVLAAMGQVIDKF